MDERGVAELGRRQHGLVTFEQVLRHGGTKSGVQRRIDSGAWERLRRGVYLIGGAPRTWEQDVVAACLSTGPDAVASHRTAIRLWGLVPRSGRIEVSIPSRRRIRQPLQTVHRSLLLPALDRTVVGGVPVTTVARSILDASAGQEPKVVGLWIDDAMRRLRMNLVEVRSCAARLAGPGRRDIRAAREALAWRLDDYDPGDSELEVRALRALADEGLPPPVQQHSVRLPDGTTVRLDLAYPGDLVAIELDGWTFHGQRSAFDNDRSRRNALTLLGWDVFQFTSTTTAMELGETVRTALARARQANAS